MTNLELVAFLDESIQDEDFARLRQACDSAEPGVVVAALTLALADRPPAA